MTSSGKSWEELKRVRTCGVFALPEKVYVVSSSRTVPGFDLAWECGAEAEEIARALLQALRLCS
jgi:hypothetical protein